MNTFKCTKCKTCFGRAQELQRHLNRATDCVNGSKTNQKKSYVCKKCNYGYSRKDALLRPHTEARSLASASRGHVKTCKAKTKNKTVIKNKNIGDNNKIISTLSL